MEQRLFYISGKLARQLPYSETRRKKLLEVAKDVEQWMNDPKTDFGDVQASAKFWMRKSEILMEFVDFEPTIEFFTSDDFELGMLAWLEQDFIKQRLFR
jgi:hypothetical protein